MNLQWPLDTTVAFDPIIGEPDRDGVQGVEILEDGKVHFRLIAKEAQKAELDQFGNITPFEKMEDGAWELTLDMGVGFKYFFLKIDGADMLNPYFPIGYGCCRPMNFVDIPVPGEDFDRLENIPHGAVSRRYFYSTETGKMEIAMIYTPPAYTESKKYPVLYLQHGYGENETGWVHQGHVARIADNLIAEARMEEMIIVMANGMTQKNGVAERGLLPLMLVSDLIPFIESHYPVKTDKWNRAMAGLSMGSYHTSITTLSNPDMFGYAGLFSGFLRAPWANGADEPHLKLIYQPEEFKKTFKVFYRAMGTEDTFWEAFAKDDEFLADKDLPILRSTFGGGHDWTVWRRCIHEFLPLLFK